MISWKQTAVFLFGLLIGLSACILIFWGSTRFDPNRKKTTETAPNAETESIEPVPQKKESEDDAEINQMSNAHFFFDEKPVIWYIPGWKSKYTTQDQEIASLQKIFPDSRIEVKKWDSNANEFSYAIQNAERIADVWAIDLKNMSADEREKLILIGHSLGGKIVIRIMAQLRDCDLYIRQGILLGTAETNVSPDIRKALYASWLPAINIWSRHDSALTKAFPAATDSNAKALGAYGYAGDFHPVYLKQYECKADFTESQETKDETGIIAILKKIPDHFATKYLSTLEEEYPAYLEEVSHRYAEIVINDQPEKWDEVQSHLEGDEITVLEHNSKTDQYRVVSPNNVVICVGNKALCEEVFLMATK